MMSSLNSGTDGELMVGVMDSNTDGVGAKLVESVHSSNTEDDYVDGPQAITITIIDHDSLDPTTLVTTVNSSSPPIDDNSLEVEPVDPTTLVTTVNSSSQPIDDNSLEVETLDPTTLVTTVNSAQPIDDNSLEGLSKTIDCHPVSNEIQIMSNTSNMIHNVLQNDTVVTADSCTKFSLDQNIIQNNALFHKVSSQQKVFAEPDNELNNNEMVQKDDGIHEDTTIVLHCLVCNQILMEENNKLYAFFKINTTKSERKFSILLGNLIGETLTSRKTHSELLCSRCFNLLDHFDTLEVDLKETKEEIISKYQETVCLYGKSKRRRKSVADTKTEFIYTKVEDDVLAIDVPNIDMDQKEKFEPNTEGALDTESSQHDVFPTINYQVESEGEVCGNNVTTTTTATAEEVSATLHNTNDDVVDDWQPVTKKQKVTSQEFDASNTSLTTDSNYSMKRKRGRPRKSKELRDDNNKSIVFSIDPVDHLSTSEQQSKLNHSEIKKVDSSPIHRNTSSKSNLSLNLKSRFRCPSCNAFDFTDNKAMKAHFELAHSRIRIIKCWICREKFSGDLNLYLRHFDREHLKHDLKLEMTLLKPNKTYSRDCKLCHKTIPSSSYQRHLLSHNPVPCNICNNFILPHNLKRHINDTHTKKLSYPCSDCLNIYHDISNLRSHRKRQHLGQKARRHLCEVCGQKFVMPSDLRIHVAGVHNNTKKFVCEFCGSRFKVASNLTYHRRKHTGERPHVCNICQKDFTKPNALSKHIRQVHNAEYKGKYRKRQKKETAIQEIMSPTPESITNSEQLFSFDGMAPLVLSESDALHTTNTETNVATSGLCAVAYFKTNIPVQSPSLISTPLQQHSLVSCSIETNIKIASNITVVDLHNNYTLPGKDANIQNITSCIVGKYCSLDSDVENKNSDIKTIHHHKGITKSCLSSQEPKTILSLPLPPTADVQSLTVSSKLKDEECDFDIVLQDKESQNT